MKKLLLFSAIFTLVITSCSVSKKSNKVAKTEFKENMPVNISGIVTAIENGKDGYMATVKTNSGEVCLVTISRINLQKSGSEYKKYAVGDKIAVLGNWWKDKEGKIYVTAVALH